MIPSIKKNVLKRQKGFSLPELLVVVLIIGILVVLAIPQISASRSLSRFSSMQRQVVGSLNEARQEAMLQKMPITFRYDNINKRTIIYGGGFGAFGDSKNKTDEMAGGGLGATDIIYGRPSGAPDSPLSDGCNLTTANGGMVDITFQADGTVVDSSNNPVNNGLFFYNKKHPQLAAFAISDAGSYGGVKAWRYSKAIKAYVQ